MFYAPRPHTCMASLTINIPHQVGHLLPWMNRHWHSIITQSPEFTLRSFLVLGTLRGCWVDDIYPPWSYHTHYIIALTSCALPFHPFLPLTPGNDCSFYCLHSFAFSRMRYSWNHRVCSLFRLTFLIWSHAFRFLDVFLWLNSSFLFSVE